MDGAKVSPSSKGSPVSKILVGCILVSLDFSFHLNYLTPVLGYAVLGRHVVDPALILSTANSKVAILNSVSQD